MIAKHSIAKRGIDAQDPRGAWMETVWRDFRIAVRSLGRSKGFVAVVVATLALGIGANSAVFSLIDTVFLHPLPVANPDRVTAITASITDKITRAPLAYPMFKAMADRAKSFSGIAAFATQNTIVSTTAAEPEQIPAAAVSGNYFGVLGVRPQIGRAIGPADDDVPGAHFVVVLSDALWRRAYQRSPTVIGSTLRIGGQPFVIVGVAPRGFHGTVLNAEPELWVPATMLADLGLGGFLGASNRSRLFGLRNFRYWNVVGRLRDGIGIGGATAELNSIFAQEKANGPQKSASSMGYAGRDVQNPVELIPVNQAAASSDRDNLVRFVSILSTVVILTLLIACFNVANLLLVRNAERALELSVRTSLGASRLRIAQQLGTESLLLGLAGGIGGLAVGSVGLRVLAAFTLPGRIRLADLELGLSPRVLLVTLTLGLLTSVVVGIAPVLQSSGTDFMSTLRTARLGSQSTSRGILLAGEVALSTVLLVGAGLFIRTMDKAMHVDLGFNPTTLAAVRVNPALGGYTGAQIGTFYQTTVDRAARIPGVSGVALATHIPLASVDMLPFVSGDKAATSAGGADDQVNAGWAYVSPTYFDVLGVPVVDGRAFTPGDTARANSVAIINQAAAKALFPNGHAVGREMVHAGSMRFTIVGVVRDTKYVSVRDDGQPMVFTPIGTGFSDDLQILVRSRTPRAALQELRGIVRDVPPHPPVRDSRLVADQINTVLEPQKFGTALLGSYSIIALLIAAVGVYGLVDYVVARQQRELGIRIALGARQGEIVRLVSSWTMRIVGIGLAIGSIGAVATSRALSRFLYGVTPTDLPAFEFAVAAILLAALLACIRPALRAIRIDPVTAMRME